MHEIFKKKKRRSQLSQIDKKPCPYVDLVLTCQQGSWEVLISARTDLSAMSLHPHNSTRFQLTQISLQISLPMHRKILISGLNVQIAKTLVELFSEMIFIHGFVHGDPHPGNILVSPGGREGFSLSTSHHPFL